MIEHLKKQISDLKEEVSVTRDYKKREHLFTKLTQLEQVAKRYIKEV